MKQKKTRPPNWLIGLILALLFILIFAITIIGFIIGFEAAPPLKKIVSWTTTIIAGAIGFLLISAALIDVVKALVKKSLYKKERNNDTY